MNESNGHLLTTGYQPDQFPICNTSSFRSSGFGTEFQSAGVPKLELGNQARKLWKILSAIFLGALTLLFSCSPVSAQTIKWPQFVGIRVGLDNCYKVGLWAPVDLKLRSGSHALTGRVTIETEDGDGIPSGVVTPPDKPVQVLPGRITSVRLYVRFGRADSTLTARFLVDGDKVAAQRTFESVLEANEEYYAEAVDLQSIYAVLGASTLGAEKALSRLELEPEEQPQVAHVTDVAELPTQWYGYEGIDAVVVATDQVEMFRKLSPHSAQIEALDRWIRLGGRLVLSVGQQADEVFSPTSPWQRFLPGKLEKIISLRQTGALETYCGSSTALPQGRDGRTVLRVPRLRDVQGVVEVEEVDLPLVVRTPRGLGQIVLLAAGLDQFPLNKWQDRPLLTAKLLDLPTERSKDVPQSGQLGYVGYDDLAGQLRSALDKFTGVRVISFAWVALLIVVYILLIGPGDYLFLRRIVKRMQWTWLTFPLMVLGVSLAAYFGAYYLKGDQLRINQVDLVDVDVSSGLVRGTSWLNIFSPRMETYNLHLEPWLPDGSRAENARGYFAWLGLPGYGFGGMHPRGAGTSVWTKEYFFTPNLEALQGVPIQVWSTKSFTGRWFATAEKTLQADLTDDGQMLEGTISNPLGIPLENCMLAQDRWAYEIPRIGPGETVRIGPDSKRTDLKNLLTGRRRVANSPEAPFRLETTPYDSSDDNPARILQMMMFYNAAGGQVYTKLHHGYQTFVNLCLLLKTNRAILIAEGPPRSETIHQGAQLMRDDKPLAGPQDRHFIMYRFIFPVKKK